MASMSDREIHKRSMARALRAVELRKQGLTFKEIGRQIGYNGPVTVETARSAVKKGERILARRAAHQPSAAPNTGTAHE